MLLISVENDLKPFLTKGTSDVLDDVLLGNIVKWVSAEFERYCNRLFTKTQRTKLFDAGFRYYVLSAIPVDSTTTLTVMYDGNTQVLNTDYWVWYNDGIVEFSVTPSRSNPQQISITYTGGYAEVDSVVSVPDDIKFACVLQSAFVYRRRKDVGLQAINMPDGSVSVANPTELLPDVKSILNRYKMSNIR